MRLFAELYRRIDQTTRTGEKVAALRWYFDQAPAQDGAWALHVLTGRKISRGMTPRKLAGWAAQEADLPRWLIDECHDAVGDMSETLALILDSAPRRQATANEPGCDWPLHRLIEQVIRPLRTMPDDQQRAAVVDVWRQCDARQRFVFHKLISGAFRVGVARKLVVRAVAEAAGVDAAIMEHRLMGRWTPTAADYRRLIDPRDHEHDPGRPYPFFLAHPLADPPESLGDVGDWWIEWKWDGIRVQLIHRSGQTLAWSRGEELVTDAFPELRELADRLPDGAVLDGEVLAWEHGRPMPFSDLQKRLNRKRVQPTLFADVPIVYMAFDVLEWRGVDRRPLPLDRRRELLESICAGVGGDEPNREHPSLMLSPRVEASSWSELAELRRQARGRGVEGFMLKRRDAGYGVGRQRGGWWKWKVDPFSADCVLIHARLGSGKRASVFTDYTFGAWHDGELVPVAKAYTGLTDQEIDQVDRFVRTHTVARHGPVRVVEPRLVFELAFEGIRPSTRHRSGIAVRFPRIARRRPDKLPVDANTVDDLKSLLRRGDRQDNA